MLLRCTDLHKSYGPRTLFAGISLEMAEGEKTGLIGPNGSGKSTLMKILAGIEPADGGDLTMRRGLRLGYVAQEDLFPEADTVEGVLTAALAGEHVPERDRLAQVSIMLGRMKFADRGQAVADLSGGWKKRLAIARALIHRPDMLLLDEPTNHLDLEGIEWLEQLLADAAFAFMVVTHDRYFLENTTNRIIELSAAYRGGFLSIDGSYTRFLEKREEYLAGQASQQASVAGRVRREIEWLQRGAKARTTKAKGRVDEAHKLMEELRALKERNAAGQAIALDFAATNRQTRKLLALRQVGKSLGGRRLFDGVDLVLSPRSRVGLVGPNGSGKTTLLRIMAGQIAPNTGQVVPADGLKVVFFDQQRQQVDPAITLRRTLAPVGDMLVVSDRLVHVSGWARRFLFRAEQLDMPVGQLSGGEQARVLIAQLMLRPADVLILDEPTNDLDIPSLEVLEESLDEFAGALVLVTHDRSMLDRMCERLIGLDGLGGAGLYADLEQWERARDAAEAAEAEARRAAAETRKADSISASSPAEKRSGLRALSWKEQREWETIEQRILDAEAQVEVCHKAMEDPKVLASRDDLQQWCAKMHEAQELVQTLYARWQELEEKQGDGGR